MIRIAKDYEEDVKNPQKRSPLDITLWRAKSLNQPVHIPSFDSPFGKGRPGWHIECSAMAISSLGEQIDIHGGGKDLIFPHHEAEIAQSENATRKTPFAKTWMHTGIISYEGEKMSKSLGNLVLVSDLSKKYSTNAIRFLFLSHHYRESWEFNYSEIEEIQGKVLEIEKALNRKLTDHKTSTDYVRRFETFMDDDLDTPKTLSLIYEISQNINLGKETSRKVQKSLKSFLEILGFKFN
jgi:cysteinyl-tRNA synthetase